MNIFIRRCRFSGIITTKLFFFSALLPTKMYFIPDVPPCNTFRILDVVFWFIKLLPVILMDSLPTSCPFSFTVKLAPGELLLISSYVYWGDTIHKSTAWLFQFLCFLQLPKWIRQDWLQDWLHLCISRQEGTTENNSLPDLLSDTSRETRYNNICSYSLAFRKISNVALKASCDGKSATCTGNLYLNREQTSLQSQDIIIPPPWHSGYPCRYRTETSDQITS